MNVLIVYASVHGSTAEVAAYMGRVLKNYNVSVTVSHVDDVQSVKKYDTFILGSAVHGGMWLPGLSHFISRFEDTLAERTTYLFLTCIVALEENGKAQARERYVLPNTIRRINIPAENIEAFAGKLNWDEISGNERWLLMTRYDGGDLPIDRSESDYRDWQDITDWVQHIAGKLALKPAAATAKQHQKWLDTPGETGPL